jgi:GMP synthase (glutamine-hydrolysing)
MSKERTDLRILLIQVRKDKEMAEHEHGLIVENGNLKKEQVVARNVAADGVFDISELDAYDAVVMGGSGAYSVLDDTAFLPFLREAVQYIRERDIPFLGICFGFQVAVQALGGKVITDIPRTEAGTYIMERTHASDGDPLIGGLPYSFPAACGRKDRAEVLPRGALNYLSSERCPYHYFTFPDSRFFAVQFHPELWKESDNLIRIHHYREKYGMTDEEFERQIALFADAPESGSMIKHFVDRVVLA